MDPIANQAEQLQLAGIIEWVEDNADAEGRLSTAQVGLVIDSANKLAELVIALAEWRTKRFSDNGG